MNRYRKRSDVIRLVMVLASFVMTCEVQAKDFGVVGNTFIVAEHDMLNSIQKKLMNLQKSGKVYELQQAMKKKVVEAAFKPRIMIMKATEYRRWEYDPTYTVSKAVYDDKGKVLHPVGTVVNPIAKLALTMKVLFIDGNDNDQVRWAIKQFDQRNVKIVLERGNPFALMQKEQVRFFFDQNSALAFKLGISSFPAMATIGNGKVIMEEVVLP